MQAFFRAGAVRCALGGGLAADAGLEHRVPAAHPLRRIRRLVDIALRELDPVSEELCAQASRPSIPPECLLRASLLQKLYGIPSERKLASISMRSVAQTGLACLT